MHEYLTSKCDKWLCSQHDADEEINRTHTHFMLVNYKHTKVALTKEINKTWKGSDNFGILTTRPEGLGPYAEYPLGKYIGKGREDAFERNGHSVGYTGEYVTKFVKGYKGDREVEDDRSGSDGSSKKIKERVINKIQYKLKLESPAEQKVRKSEFVKMCITKLKEKFPEKTYDPRDVMMVIREQLIELHWTVGDYTVLDYYDTINRMETPGRWLDSMMGLLQKRKPNF